MATTKASAKQTAARKSASGKSAAKSSAKKSTARKVAAKTSSVKAAATKSTPKKAAAKKAAAKGSTGNSDGRKYAPRASEDVREEMHEMKRGELTIGRSGRKVTDPKQAIAIGLSKARREGAKVPPNPNTGR